MKKMVSIISIFLVLFLLVFSINICAVELTTVNITTDKETVHPGQTVTVNVDFGTNMGSYGANVTYDSNLLEYVSAAGITSANDTGSVVKTVYYYNASSGESPRNKMSVTFKAKEGITTSNPTNLNVTLEGMGSPDGSAYDDRTPTIKGIVVEPAYVDYNIALNYTGDVIKNKEKDMKLVVSSSMGRNYAHTRIIAEATTPTGETAKILATDENGVEYDIIQSGWGDEAGDPIGGENAIKELDVRSLFSGAGNYSITFKLIDRDNSDTAIVSKTIQVAVKDKETETTPNEENNKAPENSETKKEENKKKPATLPKTGSTIYFAILPIIAVLTVIYFVLRKKD